MIIYFVIRLFVIYNYYCHLNSFVEKLTYKNKKFKSNLHPALCLNSFVQSVNATSLGVLLNASWSLFHLEAVQLEKMDHCLISTLGDICPSADTTVLQLHCALGIKLL